VSQSPLEFLPELGALDEIVKLVRLATDRGTSPEERRTVALKACERIVRSGMLEKAEALKVWIASNAKVMRRAHSVASFLDTFRAGR
jgi:hypothetical protein